MRHSEAIVATKEGSSCLHSLCEHSELHFRVEKTATWACAYLPLFVCKVIATSSILLIQLDMEIGVRESLSDLEQRLDPELFLRAHRSAIITLNFVAEFHREGIREGTLALRNGTRFVSARKAGRRSGLDLKPSCFMGLGLVRIRDIEGASAASPQELEISFHCLPRVSLRVEDRPWCM